MDASIVFVWRTEAASGRFGPASSSIISIVVFFCDISNRYFINRIKKEGPKRHLTINGRGASGVTRKSGPSEGPTTVVCDYRHHVFHSEHFKFFCEQSNVGANPDRMRKHQTNAGDFHVRHDQWRCAHGPKSLWNLNSHRWRLSVLLRWLERTTIKDVISI